ncbi:MAG: PKD domain-containing protein, partial [Thermoplasmatales archaeon]
TLISGSIRKIRWLSGVPPSQGDSTVEIQVSLNGESGPWDTIVAGIPNNGCYQWLVDSGGSNNCRIKIIVTTSSSTASSISASDFTIIGFSVNAHGPYYGEIGEPIQFTGSAENGTPPYEYNWDFGDGNSSNEQNPTHTYSNNGNYTVILSVTDNDDITISDSTWALIGGDNSAPTAPIIKGPTNGKPDVEYNYTFVSSDDEGDELYYLIDWGDGIEEVIGVFPQGTEATTSHSWLKTETYTIKAQATDQWGAMSNWGELDVEIPRGRNIVKSSLLQLFKIYFVINQLSEILNIICKINILN